MLDVDSLSHIIKACELKAQLNNKLKINKFNISIFTFIHMWYFIIERWRKHKILKDNRFRRFDLWENYCAIRQINTQIAFYISLGYSPDMDSQGFFYLYVFVIIISLHLLWKHNIFCYFVITKWNPKFWQFPLSF